MKLWRIPNQPITYTHNHFGGLCDFEMWHITLKIITHVSSHKAIFAVYFMKFEWKPLQWRHNERDGVSNHQPHNCLLKRLCKAQIKETSKLRVTGLCEGISTGTGEFTAQRACNTENVPFDYVIMSRRYCPEKSDRRTASSLMPHFGASVSEHR